MPRSIHRRNLWALVLLATGLAAGCATPQSGTAATFRGPFPKALAEAVGARPDVVLAADCASGSVPAAQLAAYVYRHSLLAGGLVDPETLRCAESLAAGKVQTGAPSDRVALDQFRSALMLGLPSEARDAVAADLDSGARLLDEWAAADPVLATPTNERLAEHLGRLGEAHFRYPDPAAPTGLDARGEVFVRLGPPAGHEVIDFHSTEMLRRIRQLESSVYNGFRVSASEFADGELWLYNRPEPFHFLFVNDSGTFRIGTTMDLIPQRFRMGVDASTGRGGARADILLEVLRTVFRQLSPYSVEYGVRFNDLDGYVGELEAMQIEAVGRRERDPNGNSRVRRVDSAALLSDNANVAPAINSAPDQFARAMMADVIRIDQVESARRDQVAPDEQSALSWLPLSVDVRITRFLTPGGATRLDFDWTMMLSPYHGIADSLGLAWTAIGKKRGTSEVTRERLDFVAATAPDRLRDGSPVRSTSLVVPDDPGEVTAEWTLWDRLRDSTGTSPSGLLGVESLQVLDLEPLRDDGFEVSDLRALESVEMVPYPSAVAVPGFPLSIYFEIYGLDDGRDQFRVDYTVARLQKGTLLRRGSREAEAGRLISRGAGGRSAQFLILETAQWAGADTVDVEVVVTNRTGERRVRTITFEVVEN